jgi:hypothetical protein
MRCFFQKTCIQAVLSSHSICNRTSNRKTVSICLSIYISLGACGSIVGWSTMLQTGRSQVQLLMSLDFFKWPDPSSRTMALGLTPPLTEMSTRNLLGEVKCGERIRLTTLPTSVSRLSRKCGILDILQPMGLQG